MISLINFTHTSTYTNPPLQYYNNQIQNYSYKNDTQHVSYNKPSDFIDNKYKLFTNTTFENTNITNSSFEMSSDNFTEYAEIPYYIKATSMTFCIVIMCLGVIGNVMVPIVILKTKDMRNSTNIFLVNLSIADLMVLLVCTPTVLVEVNSKPETWVLGKELCLAVPFVELTVAHASVLTILAISFERYYAICEPLRAGYVCTKTRATLICALAWFFAALFTSPVLAIAEHNKVSRKDGTVSHQCLTQAVAHWQIAFFVMVIIFLFILPLIILIILYSIIAKNLINAASKLVLNKTMDPCNTRARKQVILMLGTVVVCFFICLLPYRVLAIWVIFTPSDITENISPDTWFNLLYFSRTMLYINSAINPILYNLMSSKFRIGFCKVCVCYTKSKEQIQNKRDNRAVTNGSTTSSSLTRTTNSLKKFFSHRSSFDKSDVDSEREGNDGTEIKRNSIFDKVFAKKTYVRQQSAPVCTNTKPVKINRMKSEGSMLGPPSVINDESKTVVLDSSLDVNARFIGHSGVSLKYNKSDVELDISNRSQGSLRRNVLINTTKSKSADNESSKKFVSYQKIKAELVGYHKSKSIECDLPESFV